MKYLVKFLFVCLVIFVAGCDDNAPNRLTGHVTDPEVKSILLLGMNQDLRFDSIIEIPVTNGKFEYKFEFDHPMAFDLLLGSIREKGAGRIMPLFLHNSDVELVVHAEENFDLNQISGGKLNEEYKNLKKFIDSISKTDPGFNFTDKLALGNAHIKENTSIVSYYLLLNNLLFFQDLTDMEEAVRSYNQLSKANPEHPYNNLVRNILEAIDNVQVGKEYVDFSAPNIIGEEFQLSELINGKIALLNLWATWCGPCIGKSRKVLPIYEEYKNQGFTVVGVAGEFKDTERLETFLRKEEWPWINLVELDRQNNIWQKYGVDRSGGGMFLIDQQGRLLAINPSPEEIRNEIEKILFREKI